MMVRADKSIALLNQVIRQLLDRRRGRARLNTFPVVGDDKRLFRADNDNAFLALYCLVFLTRSPLVGPHTPISWVSARISGNNAGRKSFFFSVSMQTADRVVGPRGEEGDGYRL